MTWDALRKSINGLVNKVGMPCMHQTMTTTPLAPSAACMEAWPSVYFASILHSPPLCPASPFRHTPHHPPQVNAANIKYLLPEVFAENLVRGRGLLCRSIMKSQMASPAFTPGETHCLQRLHAAPVQPSLAFVAWLVDVAVRLNVPQRGFSSTLDTVLQCTRRWWR